MISTEDDPVRMPRDGTSFWRIWVAATAFWVAAVAPAAAQRFVDVTGAAAVADAGQFSTQLTWGDYDADGDVDLYVTNWGTAQQVPPNRLFRNDLDAGAGLAFTDVAPDLGVDNDRNSTAAAWIDFDNDGDLDLYVADFFEQDFLYANDGAGQAFTEVGRRRQMVNLIKLGSVFAIAWGDYDNDGWPDLVLGKYYHDNAAYHNAQGRLEPQTDLGLGDRRDTNALTWVDYDNDGDLDLYVVNREQENALYRNDLIEGGTFAEVACALAVADAEIGQSGAWWDYDNDGDPDLYVASVGANALYRNDGGDTFVDVATEAGIDRVGSGWITAMAAWADVDGDGFGDLYLANGADRQQQPDALAAGSASGLFADSTGVPLASPSAHLAAAFADADTNGTPDLYVTDGWGLGNRLYRNDTPDSLFLRVVVRGHCPDSTGRGANCYGLGARVRLLDASTDTLVAYRQALPPAAVPRTVTGIDGRTAGGLELVFGVEPGRLYNVTARFDTNAVPGQGVNLQGKANVRGGDLVIVDEDF